MAIDYRLLDNDLKSIFERLKPRELNLDAEGVRGYYATKVKLFNDSRLNRQQSTEKFRHGALVTAAFGSVAGIGLIAAGPATVVAGATLGLAVPAAAAAAAIVHQFGKWRMEADFGRKKDLLQRSAQAVLREYQRDRQGGFFSRLYANVTDAIGGYERRAAKMVDLIDRMRVPTLEQSSAVASILRAYVSPGFADYMHRSSLDPNSYAARLMERVSRHLDGSKAFDKFQQQEGPTTLAVLRSATQPGLNSAANRLPAEALLRAAAAPDEPVAKPEPIAAVIDIAPKLVSAPVSYGWVTAAADDAVFLRSLGIELGEYNDRAGQFLVKLDASAKEELAAFEFAYPATLHTLPGGLTDAVSNVAVAPLSSFDTDALRAYRASLQFEAAKQGGEPAAAIREAQALVDKENQQRVAAAREQIILRTSEGSSLEM